MQAASAVKNILKLGMTYHYREGLLCDMDVSVSIKGKKVIRDPTNLNDIMDKVLMDHFSGVERIK